MRLGQRKWVTICLTAYAVVLFIAMTLYRLPAEKLIQRGLLRVTDGHVTMTVGSISPSFPLGYRLRNIEYHTVLGGEFSKDRIKLLYIFPEYSNLMMGYFPLLIRGVLSRGSFEIRTGISMWKGSEDSYMSLKTSEAYLEDFNFLRLLSGRGIRGKIRADVNLRGNAQDLKIDGEGNLVSEEGALESRLDQLGVNEIVFKSLKVFFSMRDGLLSLKEGQMIGPLFSGTFSGEMKLRKPLGMTLLRLTARMKAEPGLAGNEQAERLVGALGGGSKALTIKLGGTLRQPSVSWGK
jgi:type II secretion system protein N